MLKTSNTEVTAASSTFHTLAGGLPHIIQLDVAACGSASIANAADETSWSLTEEVTGIQGDLTSLGTNAARAVAAMDAADQDIASAS